MPTFDALGNPITVFSDGHPQGRKYDVQNHLVQIVSSTGTVDLSYDSNGNQKYDDKGQRFKFDAWNRLAEVWSNASATATLVAKYSYDAVGRRITEKIGNAAKIDLYHSKDWQVLEERTTSTTTQYVWSPVYVNAMVWRDRYDGAKLHDRLYVQQDVNWNVTALVNTAGTVVQRFLYEPYGQDQVLTANWTQTTDNFSWWYRFQGGRFEKATGLYHFQRRDYSPTQGRWIEEDPIGIRGGDNNFYRFEGNNPVVRVDPTGEFWLQVFGAVVGAIHGGISAYINGGGVLEILVGAGVGAAFGAIDLIGTTISVVSAAVGAGVGYLANGAEGAKAGYNVGSLVGGLGGSVGRSAVKEGFKGAARTLAYMGGGAGVGASAFAAAGWDPLVGANLGMGLGAITKGVVDWRRALFFEDLAKQSTRNPTSDTVVLGKTLQDGVSYTKVAAHYGASYLKLENWRELTKRFTAKELWRVNEAFLKQQIRAGKTIILSHDPAKATGIFFSEVQYLKQLGYRFVKEGWVWKAKRT